MNNLRELRIEKCLKQKEVAKFIGISLSAYGNYELGIRQVPYDILIRLAKFYNVSLDYLITGKERDFVYREPIKSEIERLYEALTLDGKKYVKGIIVGLLASQGDQKAKTLLKTINL